MTRNAYFGQRRQLGNRLEDFGYSDMAFATGDQDRIASLQAKLDQKNNELAKINTTIGSLTSKIASARSIVSTRETYVYGKNQLCKWSDSQSKCDQKRRDYIAQWVTPVKANINTWTGQLNASKSTASGLQVEIKNITQEIATLLEAQKLEAQSTLTLAQQGTTPEQIKIQAEAEANALAQKSKVEAEQKERKSKSTRTIILSIVLGAVLLTGIYVYYRIKKKA